MKPSHDLALAGEAEGAALELAQGHPVLPQREGVCDLLQILVVRFVVPAHHVCVRSGAGSGAGQEAVEFDSSLKTISLAVLIIPFTKTKTLNAHWTPQHWEQQAWVHATCGAL